MNKKQGFAPLAIILTVVVLLLASGGVVYYYKTQKTNQPIACTQEAKLCSDGSSVGRTGPNCEFAECPIKEDKTADWQIYKNEKYGFQVKYPQGWFLAKGGNEPDIPYLINVDPIAYPPKYPKDDIYYGKREMIEFSVKKLGSIKYDICDQSAYYLSFEKCDSVLLNNKEFVRAIWATNGVLIGVFCEKENNKEYLINVSHDYIGKSQVETTEKDIADREKRINESLEIVQTFKIL